MRKISKGDAVWKTMKSVHSIEFNSAFKRNTEPMQVVLRAYPINCISEKEKAPSAQVCLIDALGNQHWLSDENGNISFVGIESASICAIVPEWDYDAYIASKDWEERRKEFFLNHPHKCEVCGSTDSIQLHHISYDRLGYENDDDMAAMCPACHEAVHKYAYAYKHRCGDLFYIWDKATNNISNANNNSDLIQRFINKYKDNLNYIFGELPNIPHRGKTKFTKIFRDTVLSQQYGKCLPYQMIIKLIKTK